MGKPRKTGKRGMKRNKLYFCLKCYYYYGMGIPRSLWSPSPSVTAINRTCGDCDRGGK